MKVAITGGIACGKSLLSSYIRELGVEIIDADDIVHTLIPEDERRRIAKRVFADAEFRRELEAKIHPVVRERISKWLAERDKNAIAVIPLLFEVKWEKDFDIICSVVSSKENQIQRMTAMRGYSREEALSRLAAQMPCSEKAERSQYVIHNDASAQDLKEDAARFVEWLRRKE